MRQYLAIGENTSVVAVHNADHERRYLGVDRFLPRLEPEHLWKAKRGANVNVASTTMYQIRGCSRRAKKLFVCFAVEEE